MTNDCHHQMNHRSTIGQCLSCGETGLPALVSCPDCTYPHFEHDGCSNPFCLANPSLSDDKRASIVARAEQYKREQADLAERKRLYALSFGR